MKNVVTIGGGTGTFVVLTGLRRIPNVSLSAIVTSADDGGSTGRLRDSYGFLPPGDVRQALVALAEDGSILRDLFAYRFTKGDVAGHSLGNLFLTALADQSGGSVRALEEASKILRIQGSVIPATEAPATLRARFADGVWIEGQSAVSEGGTTHGRIEEMLLSEPLPLTKAAEEAISKADLIILGPGCLYSSTIASLLADGTKEALKASPAKLVYIANLFSKSGETDDFTVSDHVAEVARYAGRAIDYVVIHSGDFTDDVLEWYAVEGEFPVIDDVVTQHAIRLPLASVHVVPAIPGDPIRRSLMRHDPHLVAEALRPLLQ